MSPETVLLAILAVLVLGGWVFTFLALCDLNDRIKGRAFASEADTSRRSINRVSFELRALLKHLDLEVEERPSETVVVPKFKYVLKRAKK